VVGNPCAACLSACLSYHPFLLCRRVFRHFGRACGNCKWRNYIACCSVRDKDKGSSSGLLRLPQAGAGGTGGNGIVAALLLIKDKEED